MSKGETDRGYFTRKQVVILETIMRGSGDGDFIDLDQMLEKLPYETSKQSLQFSLRFLIQRGLVEKKPYEIRRGRRRAIFDLTASALKSFDTGTQQFDVIEEGWDDLL